MLERNRCATLRSQQFNALRSTVLTARKRAPNFRLSDGSITRSGLTIPQPLLLRADPILDRQIARLGALENLIDEDCDAPVHLGLGRPTGQLRTGFLQQLEILHESLRRLTHG